MRETYNHAPVDSNYEIKPWLDSKFKTCVPEYLESKGAVGWALSWRLGVQARDKTIECIEHSWGTVTYSWGRSLCWLFESCCCPVMSALRECWSKLSVTYIPNLQVIIIFQTLPCHYYENTKGVWCKGATGSVFFILDGFQMATNLTRPDFSSCLPHRLPGHQAYEFKPPYRQHSFCYRVQESLSFFLLLANGNKVFASHTNFRKA